MHNSKGPEPIPDNLSRAEAIIQEQKASLAAAEKRELGISKPSKIEECLDGLVKSLEHTERLVKEHVHRLHFVSSVRTQPVGPVEAEKDVPSEFSPLADGLRDITIRLSKLADKISEATSHLEIP